MLAFAFVIFWITLHLSAIGMFIESGNAHGLIFLAIFIMIDIAIGRSIHRSSVTGDYKEANTSKRLKEYHRKKMSVEHAYRIYNPETGIYENGDFTKKTGIYSDACKTALQRLAEEHAQLGTKTFAEIQNKKREYDATHAKWF